MHAEQIPTHSNGQHVIGLHSLLRGALIGGGRPKWRGGILDVLSWHPFLLVTPHQCEHARRGLSAAQHIRQDCPSPRLSSQTLVDKPIFIFIFIFGCILLARRKLLSLVPSSPTLVTFEPRYSLDFHSAETSPSDNCPRYLLTDKCSRHNSLTKTFVFTSSNPSRVLLKPAFEFFHPKVAPSSHSQWLRIQSIHPAPSVTRGGRKFRQRSSPSSSSSTNPMLQSQQSSTNPQMTQIRSNSHRCGMIFTRSAWMTSKPFSICSALKSRATKTMTNSSLSAW